MLAVERLQYIISELHKSRVVQVTELSKEIKVSEETIRRDLEKLEKEGTICRVHGGAYLKDKVNSVDKDMEEIKGANVVCIAKKSVKLIHEYESIFLDSSSMSLHIATELRNSEKKLTVITNSLKIVNELNNASHIKVILLGGELNKLNQCFYGQSTIEELNKYFADKAFFSSAGISKEAGVTDFTVEESIIHKYVLEQSKFRIYVTDGLNIGKSAIHIAAPLDSVDCVITIDSLKEHEMYTEFISKQIEVLLCSE